VRTAVITVAHGRHEHLRLQQIMLSRSSTAPDHYIVVAIDDPVIERWRTTEPVVTVVRMDGSEKGLPIAAARNAGAAEAISRGAQLLIFLDVDTLPHPELIHWYAQAARHEEHTRALLCGPVAYLPAPPATGYDLDTLDQHSFHSARPSPAPGEVEGQGDPRLFWSLSFATTTETWLQIGGFCTAYHGYGAEDTDFAETARRRGVPVTWVGGAAGYHQWHPTESPPVQHIDDILRNGAIFASRWGWWPMEGWLEQFVGRGLIHWSNTEHRYIRGPEISPTPRRGYQKEEARQ
jgi:GT2 family glycosyltransferase